MDFRNCLEPNNLTIYAANFVGGDKDTAYAICPPGTANVQIAPPSGEVVIRWETSIPDKLVRNISLDIPQEVFILTQPGVYVINYSTAALGGDVGSQLTMFPIINGASYPGYTVFPTGPTAGTLTGTYYVSVVEGTPATVSFKLRYAFATATTSDFRYFQCSIVKIDN